MKAFEIVYQWENTTARHSEIVWARTGLEELASFGFVEGETILAIRLTK